MQRRIPVAILVMCCLIGLLVNACSKITNENYAKIETGMRYDEVVAILGPPDKVEEVVGTKSAVWGNEPKTIRIKFVADMVIFRSAQGLD